MTADLPTFDQLNELVDSDPIKLRDEAFALRARAEHAEAAIARVQALVNLPERPEDYDEVVTQYQAVVGSTWDEAYWHAAMSHVDAALGAVPGEHTGSGND